MAKTKGAKTGVYGNKIDKKEFEDLCSICCTRGEICGVFGVSEDTLLRFCKANYDGRTFEETYPLFASKAKASLRRTQFRQAETNPTMAIWLGKQYLGQSDIVEQQTTSRIEVVNDVPTE